MKNHNRDLAVLAMVIALWLGIIMLGVLMGKAPQIFSH